MSSIKKKRILPDWMTSPCKETSSTRKKCIDNSRESNKITDFFKLQQNKTYTNKQRDAELFDFQNISENLEDESILVSDKEIVYIMSPAELEEIARLVLLEN